MVLTPVVFETTTLTGLDYLGLFPINESSYFILTEKHTYVEILQCRVHSHSGMKTCTHDPDPAVKEYLTNASDGEP